jgi:uncharacterized protein (DUF1501 family)
MRHTGRCGCTRRSFLHGAGLTLTGMGLSSLFPSPFVRFAMADGPANGKRLLFLFQRGACDAINTVIPHGDTQYNTTNRPTLYLSPAQAINLNGFASLHPALSDLTDVYNVGRLAVVHRVGYPNQSRSHFDSQRIWENGTGNANVFEGWLHRYVRENAVAAGVDLPVLTAQATPPLILRGQDKYVNVANPDNFDYFHTPPKRDKYEQAWRRRFSSFGGPEPYRAVLSQTGVKLVDTLSEYRTWDQANWDPKDPNTGNSLFPVSDATNPNDPAGPNGKKFSTASYSFFRSVKLCALSLLESDGLNNNGTRIAGTELNGWDTHDNQGTLTGEHPELLGWLGYAMRSLHIALSGAATDPRNYSSIWNDTVVVTLTEFGRTTIENGSAGTDHAEACCLFAMGGGVNGGVYNCDATTWPAGVMFDVSGRYLSHRTDYRSVMWELLRDHMGASVGTLEAIFPSYGALGLGAGELGLV